MALWTPRDGAASVTFREMYDFGTPADVTVVSSAYSAARNCTGSSSQDASQGTSANRPAVAAAQINGLDCARTTIGSGKSLLRTYYSPNDLRFVEADFGGIGFYKQSFAGFTDSDSGKAATHMWMLVYGSTGCQFFRDDNSQWTNGLTFSNDGIAWWIGQRDDDSGWGSIFDNAAIMNEWPGYVLEIGRATGTVTTADRNKLFGYGCWRAGIQANLPGGHPYISAAPTTGAAAAGTVLRNPASLILPNLLR